MKLTCSLAIVALACSGVAAEAEITAVGRAGPPVRIAGPDELGHYSLRVSIADLDPATDSGWARMTRRVDLGTALLCDQAAPQAYAGYYHRDSRDCRAESAAAAAPQMARARALASGGQRVAFLDVTR